MESFYGGRQGAPFVIVKRFDGIDIPENSKYKYKNLAYDYTLEKYIIDSSQNFIFQNIQNYSQYNWKKTQCNGQLLNCVIETTSIYTTKNIKIEYQEGLKQCFIKQTASLNEVNYGEYVIIDNSETDEDVDFPHAFHGNIYQRNFDYDETNFGAKYIGNISGPKGFPSSGVRICAVTTEDIGAFHDQPPEIIMNSNDYKGWCVVAKDNDKYYLYAFNYWANPQKWYKITDFDIKNAIMDNGKTLQNTINNFEVRISSLESMSSIANSDNLVNLHNNIYRGATLVNEREPDKGLFPSLAALNEAISRDDFSNIYIGDQIKVKVQRYDKQGYALFTWNVAAINFYKNRTLTLVSLEPPYRNIDWETGQPVSVIPFNNNGCFSITTPPVQECIYSNSDFYHYLNYTNENDSAAISNHFYSQYNEQEFQQYIRPFNDVILSTASTIEQGFWVKEHNSFNGSKFNSSKGYINEQLLESQQVYGTLLKEMEITGNCIFSAGTEDLSVFTKQLPFFRLTNGWLGNSSVILLNSFISYEGSIVTYENASVYWLGISTQHYQSGNVTGYKFIKYNINGANDQQICSCCPKILFGPPNMD